MASWYGILMNHQSRHRELLREAARDRLANDLLREQSSPNPPNSRADRRRPSPLWQRTESRARSTVRQTGEERRIITIPKRR